MTKIRFLGVHGLGDHRTSPWRKKWEQAVRERFPVSDELELEFDFLSYDDIFEQTEISFWESTKAVAKLLRSGIGSVFRRRARGSGFTSTISDRIRWSAGYVVAWVEDKGFQEETRKRFLTAIRERKPDVVLAHSLGSLVTYNALTHPDANTAELQRLVSKLTYITLGSQIGNGFVSGNLTGGRVLRLDVRKWFHLYNREDDVFTAPIRLYDADNFEQIDTFFDIDGFADHEATEYLSHRRVESVVWPDIASHALTPQRAARGLARPPAAARRAAKRDPRKRAILIGINDYPDSADRLEGCVNDVFHVSSALQECGFAPEDIRTCLDRRATAHGILERLEWLLTDPIPEDTLFFYYSGHGARLPTYGEGDQVDRMDESLVPWDFDWSPETCVTDDQIYDLYSQLPYETRLVMAFDCCHSGGIHRDGGPRVRGLTPPDDIRHRALRWNLDLQMWEDRDLGDLNRGFSPSKAVREDYFGSEGTVTRLGRGSRYRVLRQKEFDAQRRALGQKNEPFGPYLPVIFEACRENQYAYEYRHGVTSYGAFTYSLVQTLRREQKITFRNLKNSVREQLEYLGYDQEPQILGPNSILDANVPWMAESKKTGKQTAKRSKRRTTRNKRS